MGLAHDIRTDLEGLARVEPDEMLGRARRHWRRWRSATRHDGFKVLLLTRCREAARRRGVPGVNHVLRLVTRVLYGIDIGNEVEFGPGVDFSHSMGTVIGGPSTIGARVQFMGNNTVGTAKANGCPIIEADVVLGCGSRILGPVRVGRGAVIGANAVVLHDVPSGATAVGVPALSRPVPIDQEELNASIRRLAEVAREPSDRADR